MTKSDDAVKNEEKVEGGAAAETKKSKKGKADKAKSKDNAKNKDKSKDKADKADKKSKGKNKDKAKGEAKPAKKAPAERDQFGFRKGSKKSDAAKLYSSKKGATLAEVEAATGSKQLNLIKELEEAGWEIGRSKEGGDGAKQVTRYKIGEQGKPKPKAEKPAKADKKDKSDKKAKADKAEKSAKKGKGKKSKK